MKCDKCRAAEARVHLTQVMEGRVLSVHLCEDCARKSGFSPEDPSSLSELLFGLGVSASPPAGEENVPPPAPPRCCSTCGASLGDFKAMGRLGCPDCYVTFESELEELIRQMHRADRHVGRRPRARGSNGAGRETGAGVDVAELQRELERAVAEERYEDAARLRDRIAALRGSAPAPDRRRDAT